MGDGVRGEVGGSAVLVFPFVDLGETVPSQSGDCLADVRSYKVSGCFAFERIDT